MTANLQPDQRADAWGSFAARYQQIFEPLTNDFAAQVFDWLGELKGKVLLDIGCGPGAAALMAASRGAQVIAIDASPEMIASTDARAKTANLTVQARVMDAMRLGLPDQSVDIAYSAFGLTLLPDAMGALTEVARTLRPGGQAAVLTWTEPERYELIGRLRRIANGFGCLPPSGPLPAQLRHADPEQLADLVKSAGLRGCGIHRLEATLVASTAAALVDNLAFAPGMAATLDGFGREKDAVLAALRAELGREFGAGPIRLGAVAHVGIATTA